MLAARVEPKNGPGKEETKKADGVSQHSHGDRFLRSERRMFAEQVELPRVVATSGCNGIVVTAYFGEVGRLELQSEFHQGVRNVSGGFIGDGVFGRLG